MIKFVSSWVNWFACHQLRPRSCPVVAVFLDAFIKKTGAKISHGSKGAYYMPLTDSISLPVMENFKDLDGATAEQNYYGTLFHELTHWTGDSKRCNRDNSTDILKIERISQLQDVDKSAGQNADMPKRFLPPLTCGLSYYMAMKRPNVPNEKIAMLKGNYEELLLRAMEEDKERASIFFRPKIRTV